MSIDSHDIRYEPLTRDERDDLVRKYAPNEEIGTVVARYEATCDDLLAIIRRLEGVAASLAEPPGGWAS